MKLSDLGLAITLMKSLPIICLMLFMCGCSSTWTKYEPFSTTRLAAKPKSSNMPMSSGEPIGRRYEKLGVVWSSWYTFQSAEQHVREKAKEIGADAVINLRYTTYDVDVNYALGSFSSIGSVSPTGTYAATSSGGVLSAGYTDGYPKVVGIAIRFIDGKSDEPIQFTNPNIVDSSSNPK